MTAEVLVAVENAATRNFLADNLCADGYAVDTAASRPGALTKLAGQEPDAVVCDVDGETLSLVDSIRAGENGQIDPTVALLVLSAGDPHARVRYLERGGDDVLAHPFSYPELRARVRALIRRRRGHYDAAPRRVQVGPLEIDPAARNVRLDGAPVDLSRLEYALLATLARDPARVHTKAQLLASVWDCQCAVRTRTVDSHACRLRRKLAHRDTTFVVNTWGVGYALVDALSSPRPIARSQEN